MVACGAACSRHPQGRRAALSSCSWTAPAAWRGLIVPGLRLLRRVIAHRQVAKPAERDSNPVRGSARQTPMTQRCRPHRDRTRPVAKGKCFNQNCHTGRISQCMSSTWKAPASGVGIRSSCESSIQHAWRSSKAGGIQVGFGLLTRPGVAVAEVNDAVANERSLRDRFAPDRHAAVAFCLGPTVPPCSTAYSHACLRVGVGEKSSGCPWLPVRSRPLTSVSASMVAAHDTFDRAGAARIGTHQAMRLAWINWCTTALAGLSRTASYGI